MEIRQAISMYLTAKAYNEPEFKVKFENPNKNLDECVMFIQYKMFERIKDEAEKNQNQVGVVIPSDDEIFALAVQYYLDEDLKVEGINVNSVKVLSYAATSFTEEEKKKMREDAIKKYQEDVIAEQRKKDAERKKKAEKPKKPTAPVLVPDTTDKGEEPAKSEEKEVKKTAVQMDLFG